MIDTKARRLWSAVILQAIKDAKGLRNVHYKGDKGHYGAQEAKAWLDHEGKELMLIMGFSITRVNWALEDKGRLLELFEKIAS